MNPPRRIVSLLSSNTEMACALGLGERLVGVSHECDWPPEIDGLPRVTRTRIDAEATSDAIDRQVGERLTAGLPLYEIDEARLRRLEPDLILTQAQCEVCAVDLDEVRAAVERFPPERRPRVESFQPNSIEDVLLDMMRLGRAAEVESEARRAVERARDRIDRVESAAAEVPLAARPVVLTLEWLDPPMPGGCWTPQLVEMAGGRHALNRPGVKTRPVSWEAIAATRADALVLCPCGFKIEKTLGEIEPLLARPAIRALPAFSRGAVFAADGNALFNRPGPRLVDTLELLFHLMHPDRAAAAGVPMHERMVARAETNAMAIRGARRG